MEATKHVIKLWPTIVYEDTDITRHITRDLLSLSYTDSIDDEADSLDLELSDKDGKWCNEWLPDRGNTVKVILMNTDNLDYFIDTGKMQVDRLQIKGLPKIIQISAVSIPLNNTIRRKNKTRTFENTDLITIAQNIANDAKLELFTDIEEEIPKYDRIDQDQESDLVFLRRLCKDAGLTVKVAVEKLIIFDQRSYEKKPAVMTIQLGISQVLSYSFESQQHERYRSCTIKWRNPRKKTSTQGKISNDAQVPNKEVTIWDKEGNLDLSYEEVPKGSQQKRSDVFTYTYIDETVDESGQEYVIKKRCTSASEAERLCKAKLRELNLRQVKASISMVGQLSLYAGAVVNLVGFSAMDGKFIIERITHSYSAQGYLSQLDLRAINANY